VPWHYYILNNNNPGYLGNLGANVFTVLPTSVSLIGDAVEKNISFKYCGEGWDNYVAGLPNAYCNICNGFQYATDIMTSATLGRHIQDETSLFSDISATRFPQFHFSNRADLWMDPRLLRSLICSRDS
jgi:phospholipase C